MVAHPGAILVLGENEADNDQNVCVIEPKNVPVSARILPRVL
jgi:hypothetical protein